MAIIIKADYGKKIGLPNYSSHQFSVSLTAEVADISQVKAEAERLYAVLQESVDSQIVKNGFTPGESAPVPAGASFDASEPAAPPAVGGEPVEFWKCSPAQKNLILDLVVRNHLEKNAVEDLAKERFGVGVRQLNKLQASGLIDELMGAGPAERPRFTGNRSAPRRTNGHAYPERRVS